jgi:hypothetical protein
MRIRKPALGALGLLGLALLTGSPDRGEAMIVWQSPPNAGLLQEAEQVRALVALERQLGMSVPGLDARLNQVTLALSSQQDDARYNRLQSQRRPARQSPFRAGVTSLGL